MNKIKTLMKNYWEAGFAFLAFFFLGLAFAAPSYGPICLVFGAIFALLLWRKEDLPKKRISLLLWCVPFLLLAILPTIFQVKISGLTGVLLEIFNIIALIGYGFLGWFLRKKDSKTWTKFILGALFALTLIVWISLIASLSTYGPFYTLLYEDKVYYWEGMSFLVSEENVFFTIFGLSTVSLSFASTLPFLLTVSGTSLFFLSPKKNFSLFIGIAIASFSGFLYLLLAPDLFSILLSLLFAFGALFLRFLPWKEKPSKGLTVLAFSLMGILTIGALIIFFLAYSGVDIYGSGIFRKLFDNQRYMEPLNMGINVVNQGNSFLSLLFGLNPYQEGGSLSYTSWNNTFTYWVDIPLSAGEIIAFQEGGILAFLAMVFLFFLAIYVCYQAGLMYKYKKDPYPVIFALLAMAWLFYESLQADAFPFVQQKMTYLSPFFGNGGFALTLFSFAFVFSSKEEIYLSKEFCDEKM